MKKLNLICASIALVCGATAATAGTLSTADVGGTVFATENFGGSTSATTDTITPSAVTYSMSNITAVNAGASVYFTVRLNGAKFAAAPAANRFSFAGQAAGTDIAAVALSADKSTVLVTVTSAGSVNIGLGAFTYTPAAANIDNVNSTLATPGGAVTVSIGLTTVAPSSYEATDAQGTVDAPLASGTLASAAKAINGTVSASGTTTKIDLTATPPASAYTATRATLGKIVFSNVSGTQNKRAGGGVDYTLAAGSGGGVNTGVSVVVTPGTGQAFPVGATLVLNTAEDCLAATDLATTGSGTTAFTAVSALTAKTIATTTAVTTGTALYVCMLPPSAGNTAAPLQATLAATVAPAATTDLIATASGTGYALDYNGSTVEVTSYWPGALDAYQYKGYLKITNTGSVSAVITGQHRDKSGNLVGTGKALNVPVKLPNGILAAGQSVMLSSVEIDAVLGANPAGLEQGRLRLTAPTNGLRVQSLLQTGADAPIEYSTTNGI